MNNHYIHIVFSLLLLFLFETTHAQNLVPNPGFEDLNKCPDDLGNIDYSPGYTSFTYIKSWVKPTGGSSDCFNSCGTYPANMPNTRFGFHFAHSGGGMAGLYGYFQRFPSLDIYCEYLQCRLDKKLVAGTRYTVQFYLYFLVDNKLGNNIWTVDKIGVNLSDTQYYDRFQYGSVQLQYSVSSPPGIFLDKANQWVKIKGDFIAKGGEEWLTLGVFDDGNPKKIKHIRGTFDSTTDAKSYYLIDNVYLGVAKPCDTTSRTIDTNICKTSYTDVELTAALSDDTYLWNTGSTNRTTKINGPGVYWCNVQDGCRLHTDTFIVHGFKEETYTDSIISCTGMELLKPPVANGLYTWSTGDTTFNISTKDYVNYWCMSIKDCIIRTDTFKIIYAPRIDNFSQTNDTTICKGEKMLVGELYGRAKKYLWSTGENSCCIYIGQPGTYTLTVYDDCQVLTDSFSVTDKECNNCIVLPTAFTPNADALNDRFGPIILCPVTDYLFMIYNRIGNLVFTGNNPSDRWDGTIKGSPAASGVYSYFIKFNANNSTSKQMLKGNITLLR